MLVKCDCTNTGQDRLHGKSIRVANSTNKSPVTYRCTVCGTEHRK